MLKNDKIKSIGNKKILLGNLLNQSLKSITVNRYKINIQLILLRLKNTVGYIKFVDKKYMKGFFALKSMWLSNIDNFTANSEESADNLIDDKFEGKLHKLVLDMPAFITSFTELDKCSFDENGFIKKEISSALINCEKKLGNNRDFIFIPYKNMVHLLNEIKHCQLGKVDGIFKYATVFSRKVCYIKDYKNNMDKLEKDYFDGNRSAEQVGKDFLGTKSVKYAIQNEFRLGIVIPLKKSNFGKKPGVTLVVKHPLGFATRGFKKEELRSLNIDKLN